MATVTIPTKNNLNRNSGAVLLRVSTETDALEKETLLTTGDFALSSEGGFLTLSSAGETLNLPVALFPGKADVLWTWIENNHRLIVTGDEGEGVIGDMRHEASQMTGNFGDVLVLSNTPVFTGTYQRIACYAKDFLYNEGTLAEKDTFIELGDLLFEANFDEAKHYTKAPIIETTFAPRDGSPILISDEQGPLRRQYFFDYKTGEYTDVNTERFVYRSEDSLILAYDGLSPDFKTYLTFENGETFIATHIQNSDLVNVDDLTRQAIEEHLEFEKDYLTVTDEGATGYALIQGDILHLNFSKEEKERFHGQEVSITYQLRRSYNVEYNTDTAYDSLRIQLTDHQNQPLEVTQEGNRFSNTKLGKEVDLNPLVNPRHTGFLYIDKENQTVESFRLNVSNPYVLADGMDTADFIIEAIDKEGNEVLSPYIDVFIMDETGHRTNSLGELSPVIHYDTMKARNMAGRCYYQYRSPRLTTEDYAHTKKVFAVALDRQSGIGMQVPLYIRPVNPETGQPVRHRTLAPGIGLVFEYVARLFERELPDGHPLTALDENGDGQLDRKDFRFFESKKHNNAFIQELYNQLKEREG